MELGLIRQGDILLRPIEGGAPANAKHTSEVIMALSETTGHAHRLRADTILEWSVEGRRYVQVVGDVPGTISHEDHDPTPAAVVTPRVTYEIIPQREWDLSGQWRKVTD